MAQNLEPQEAFFVPVENGVNTLPWRYLAASEHDVALLDEVDMVTRQLVFAVDYSISPEGDIAANVGEITLLVKPTDDETKLRVRGNAAAIQAVPEEPGTSAIVASLDRMAIVAQQIKEGIARVDVPAEIELSQAAAGAAAQSVIEAEAAAGAAAQSALDAALFDPDNFQPIDQSLADLSGQTVTAHGLDLLAAQDESVVRNLAGLDRFSSAGQAIISGGLVTVAHGLPAPPAFVQFRLVCILGDAGYSIGDTLILSPANQGGTAVHRSNTVRVDAANIYVRFSDVQSCFVVGHAATGAVEGLLNSKWELYLEALT